MEKVKLSKETTYEIHIPVSLAIELDMDNCRKRCEGDWDMPGREYDKALDNQDTKKVGRG